MTQLSLTFINRLSRQALNNTLLAVEFLPHDHFSFPAVTSSSLVLHHLTASLTPPLLHRLISHLIIFTHTPSPPSPLQTFFPDLGSNAKDVDPKKKAERAKKIMMQEYFSESGRVPEVEGVLYMKEGLKKPWKKYFFMLRASGLYHSTKGKSKVS